MSKMFANRLDRTLYVHDGAANYIVGYILQIILQFLFSLIVLATTTTEESTAFQQTATYLILISFMNELAFGLTPLTYSKVLGQNYYKDMGFKKKLSIVQTLLLVLTAIVLVIASSPIAQWVTELILKSGYDGSSILSLEINSPQMLILGIVFMAIVPAFAEEILFRGMMARAFKRKSYVFAIFMCAFMFAIMHGNPIQLVHQFILGIVLCVVYFATGSIYAPIIVHFLNNTIAIVGSYITYYHPFTLNTVTMVLMVVLGMIALAITLYLLIKTTNKGASIKNGFKAFESTFRTCFMSDEEKAKEIEDLRKIEDKIEDTGMAEVKEVYAQVKETMDQDEKLKARRAMILALVLAIAVFTINTILGYIG